jgi:hypothetical protein
MNDNKKPTQSRANLVIRSFFALPVFLLLTIIFWEIIVSIWLLSNWFYDKGCPILGLSTKIAAIALAALTIFLTVKFFVGWIIFMFHRIKGDKI